MPMSDRVFWGDLHSHCSISYGLGTVEQALMRAREQLDFCSITGHAFWPDMPSDRDRYGEIIDYHNEGFARLAGNWDRLIETQKAASEPGWFLAFPSYEWHSLKYGDHNVYAAGPNLPLRDAADLPGLREVARDAGGIAVPHHIGYAAGYRGIDWSQFHEDVSPFVEIFSLHCCSESEAAPFPMLHDMGPRDAGSTAEAGWDAGHRFGIIASTDHHGGYPGSHGDGRIAVIAEELTRESIWNAFLARRVYAVTGDKIEADFQVDGAPIGSVIQSKEDRHITLQVRGSDALDRVEILKNGRIIRRVFPDDVQPDATDLRYRLRITWGWGRKDEPVNWESKLSLSAGTITKIESCFSGQTVVAPQGVGGHKQTADSDDLPHKITASDATSCAWQSVTTGNLTTRHPTTQAISFEIDAPLDAVVTVETNGQRYAHPLHEITRGGRCHYLRGWLSEAICIGPLVAMSDCTAVVDFTDSPEKGTDVYRARIAQTNGQWAWLTPVWVER